MKYLDDPFDYPDEEESKEIIRLRKRAKIEQETGQVLPTWGGARKGAGRKRGPNRVHYFRIRLDNIQEKLLAELGEGSIEKGVIKLIERNI